MKRKKIFLIVILVVIFLALPACGKKGPPILSGRHISLKVEELKGEWKRGAVVLNGRVPPLENTQKSGQVVTGCRVYHVWYSPANPPCEGCPIDFRNYREVKGELLKRGNFSCEVITKKRKGVHFFEVRLLGQGGAVGPASNRVKLIIED